MRYIHHRAKFHCVNVQVSRRREGNVKVDNIEDNVAHIVANLGNFMSP